MVWVGWRFLYFLVRFGVALLFGGFGFMWFLGIVFVFLLAVGWLVVFLVCCYLFGVCSFGWLRRCCEFAV